MQLRPSRTRERPEGERWRADLRVRRPALASGLRRIGRSALQIRAFPQGGSPGGSPSSGRNRLCGHSKAPGSNEIVLVLVLVLLLVLAIGLGTRGFGFSPGTGIGTARRAHRGQSSLGLAGAAPRGRPINACRATLGDAPARISGGDAGFTPLLHAYDTITDCHQIGCGIHTRKRPSLRGTASTPFDSTPRDA